MRVESSLLDGREEEILKLKRELGSINKVAMKLGIARATLVRKLHTPIRKLLQNAILWLPWLTQSDWKPRANTMTKAVMNMSMGLIRKPYSYK